MDGDPDGTPTPGPDAADKVVRLVEEARSLWEARRLADSEAPLRRALDLAEQVLGPDHTHTAYVLAHVGWLALARERHEEAVAAYRRALAIREARLGPDHPDTLHAMEELAATLFGADAHDEADALALRALAGHDAASRDDAGLAGLIATLAWRRFWIGRHAEAEPMFLRALALRERHLGPGDPATADTAQRLAVMYDRWGFDADPEPYYRRALAGYEAAHPDVHLDMFEARYRLADYLHRRGRDDEAAPLFERLAATLRSAAKAIDPGEVHWMLDGLCDYLREAGREGEAGAVEAWAGSYDGRVRDCRAEAERAEAAFGPESPELDEALVHLAAACAFAGLADAAAAAARRVLEARTARLGPDDPSTGEAAERLAKIRGYASARAEEPRAPRRLGRKKEELFDAFTRPWADERRPDLIRAYLTTLADDEDEGDPTGAGGAIIMLTVLADLDEQWGVILELIAAAPDHDQVLQAIAAGPLEGFLSRFDAAAIDRVEAEAARDPKFRRVLSGVWKLQMSDPVWERVRALQATVPDPLPEMRPFAPGESPRPEDDR